MAQLTIRLVVDAQTGKKNVIISYESESDALPMEHEEDHRRIVDRLIEGGALGAAELGKIIVEREEEQATTDGVTDGVEQSEGTTRRESIEQDQ